jgi:uroporphyrinogen-III decarboxylase
MGNIDIRVLESGNRDRIAVECTRKLNGMRALRAPYVFMSDHSISPNVAYGDYIFALNTYRENCAY